jgi:anti-anti-sigma factor
VDLQYQTRIEGDKGIVMVEGDFDNEAAGEALRVAVNRLLDNDKHTVVLDLRKVDIINEYGLGKILSLQKRLAAEKGLLKVKPLTGFVREVVDLLMLTELLPIDSDEETAAEN